MAFLPVPINCWLSGQFQPRSKWRLYEQRATATRSACTLIRDDQPCICVASTQMPSRVILLQPRGTASRRRSLPSDHRVERRVPELLP